MSSGSVVREGATGDSEGSTDDVMGRPIKLFLQVDDGERHAEKVDGVASPGQPAAGKRKSRSKFNHSWQRQGRTQRGRDPTASRSGFPGPRATASLAQPPLSSESGFAGSTEPSETRERKEGGVSPKL